MSNVPTIDELLKNGLLRKGNDERLQIRRIPLGIPIIDKLIGGGLPIGRPMLLFGPESTGKTLLAQYACAAIQKTERPTVLLMDMERSYDQQWWEQSGVDTSKLIVSNPATAEQAIDIMRAMLLGQEDLGGIVLDSIAAMVPAPEADPERSSEDKTIGLQARVVTLMYRQIMSLIDNTVFIATNQMRENIGTHDVLKALPGGRAQRHFSQIIMGTQREGWIIEGKSRIGFHMEVGVRKNKTSAPIMDNATVDFLFRGQIDFMTTYLDQAIEEGLITSTGAWLAWDGKKYLGKPRLRQHFVECPDEFEDLKRRIAS